VNSDTVTAAAILLSKKEELLRENRTRERRRNLRHQAFKITLKLNLFHKSTLLKHKT
jgi:hypothetical protein